MTPAKQFTDYSCVLACVESLAKDKKMRRSSQQEMVDDYPQICSKGRKTADGKPMDGAVTLADYFPLMRKLGLASRFEIGFGRAFIEANKPKLADGIFLQTTHHPDGTHGGYHFWRLENTDPDFFLVVEPSRHEGAAYIKHVWGDLELRGCVVIVCIT